MTLVLIALGWILGTFVVVLCAMLAVAILIAIGIALLDAIGGMLL